MNQNTKGFTLIEILVVLVIVGVMAGLAVPTYFRTIEQARTNEAKVNLNIIHTAQKIYKLNNNAYWPPSGTSTSVNDINTNLNIDISSDKYNLTVGPSTASNYTATARRNKTGSTKTFTINETGVISESGSF
jgi:prepilin-type N-terminal cleavage/methylation domain-containing protein